jgi:hypothetical protein
MSLLDLPAFESSAPILREGALKLRTSPSSVTILGQLSEVNIITSAILEGAMLDAGIPYQRRLRDDVTIPKGPCIHIQQENQSSIPPVNNNPLYVSLCPVDVDALVSNTGDVRRGVLSTVALAGALAESISPKGEITTLVRPWILAGNWLSDALEHTYDPVYTVLRDYLSQSNAIRVVPLPEVPDSDPRTLPGVDAVAVSAIRDRWGKLDLEGRAQALSHLLKPILISDLPSTARFEELGWHRIMSTGWEKDLASQLIDFTEKWRDDVANRKRYASLSIDNILRQGKLT